MSDKIIWGIVKTAEGDAIAGRISEYKIGGIRHLKVVVPTPGNQKEETFLIPTFGYVFIRPLSELDVRKALADMVIAAQEQKRDLENYEKGQ